jgi:hypothetical protein
MGLFSSSDNSGNTSDRTVVEYRTRTGGIAKAVANQQQLAALRACGRLVADLGKGNIPVVEDDQSR